jgi:hypothetical protein
MEWHKTPKVNFVGDQFIIDPILTLLSCGLYFFS